MRIHVIARHALVRDALRAALEAIRPQAHVTDSDECRPDDLVVTGLSTILCETDQLPACLTALGHGRAPRPRVVALAAATTSALPDEVNPGDVQALVPLLASPGQTALRLAMALDARPGSELLPPARFAASGW